MHDHVSHTDLNLAGEAHFVGLACMHQSTHLHLQNTPRLRLTLLGSDLLPGLHTQ